MEHPFLFNDVGRWQASNDEVGFTSCALLRFGECAARLVGKYGEWPVLSATRKVWRDALAAEALLFNPGYRVDNPPFSGFLTDEARPCGAPGPSYGELKACPAAAALFPMSGDRPRPGRIWAVGAGADGQLPPERPLGLAGCDDVLKEAEGRGIRLYAEACEGCDGGSWQLAAHLAMDACEADDLDYRVRLASEWWVTGEVCNGRIQSVGIRNKPECGYDARRRWLLPECNVEAFRRAARSCGLTEPSCTAVRTLGDAIEGVRGAVARRRPPEPWPREAVCAHVAVVADAGPVWRLLERIRFRELHLWSLGVHPEVADGLYASLREKFPRLKVQTHNGVAADALEEISRALHNHFGASPTTVPTLFDVTAASWLFRVAAEGAARRFGFALVCQEKEASPYVKLWHMRGVQQFCQMVTTDKRPALTYAPNFIQSRVV